MRPDWLPR